MKQDSKSSKPSFLEGIQKHLLRGALLFFPFAAVLWGFSIALKISDGLLGPVVDSAWKSFFPMSQNISHSPLISLGLLLMFFYALGLLVTWRIGDNLFKWLESQIVKLPGVGKPYSSLRKAVAMVGNGEAGNSFQRVVYVPFTRGEGETIGFVTNEIYDSARRSNVLVIFVPTPPNPFGGFLAFYCAEEVRDAPLTVEEAVQMCFTLGIVVPEKLKHRPIDKQSSVTNPDIDRFRL
jgi:uncharacterized membrane protein